MRNHPHSPRTAQLLVTQFLDGFGARFHGVLLALYTLRVGGMSGFAGFTAMGLVGVVLSTLAAGWLTGRFGMRRTMRISGYALAGSRVATYVFVGFGFGVMPLLVLRLVGSVAGQLVMNMAKAQVPQSDDEKGNARAATSLAWVNVANAGGQRLATAAAGLSALLGPAWLIALVGAPIATLPTLPMLRLARFATDRAIPLREQLRACRDVAPAALLAAAVTFFVAGLANLKDGLTVDLDSASWLGPVAAASLAGSFLAAAALPRLARFNAHPKSDFLVWPLLGALALAGWAFADAGVEWLLASQFVGGLASQVLGSLTEARILGGAGREGAVSALTVSGGVGAFASALSALAMPPLLQSLGYAASVVAVTAPLLLLAAFGGARVWARARA
jgi:hypothetical protein